jgi:hypothetical protein
MFTIFVVFVAAAVFAMYIQQGRQRGRLLHQAPPRPLAEMPEDTPGRVVGIAQPIGDALTAPLSGRRCVYYVARVERRSDAPPVPAGSAGPPAQLTVGAATHPAATHTQPAAGDAAGHDAPDDPAWSIIASETGATAFVIQDETGRAVVEPAAAKFDLQFAPSVGFAGAAELTSSQREFLARHRIDDRLDWLLDGQSPFLRYREATIAIGEAITVVGSGTREPDPDAAPVDHYRGDPPTRLRFAASARHPLVVRNDR